MRLYDHKGRPVDLGPPLTSGGEGAICRVAGPSTEVAKVFHPPCRTGERSDKVVAMILGPPDEPHPREPSLGWPRRGLFNDPHQRGFVGFTMPIIKGAPLHKLTSTTDRTKALGGQFNWRYMYTLALNLACVVERVHRAGHRVGDLRETNILAYSNARLALIDCDSFQIRQSKGGRVFHCRVGTPEYTPLEAFGVNFGTTDYDRYYSDLFALGVMLFGLLMEGYHPYNAVFAPGIPDAPMSVTGRIREGRFAYGGGCPGVTPPPTAPPFAMLPPEVQCLFLRCFGQGHGNRLMRPSAHDWRKALERGAQGLRQCKRNVNHWLHEAAGSCPWCRTLQRTGKDPFPGPAPGLGGLVGRLSRLLQ